MVSATSTNTVGFFVWTVAITIAGWLVSVGDAYYKNYRSHSANPLVSALRDSWFTGLLMLSGVITLTLLAWGVSTVVVIYRGHLSLVETNSVLREQLAERNAIHLALRIKGWITNQDQNRNAIVQVWLAVDNSGGPDTLRDWKLSVRTGNVIREGRHTIGQPALKGGLNIPFLDVEFQRPVATVADVQGYVTFSVVGVNQRQFNDLYLDHSTTLIVSAIDSKGRTVSAEKNNYQTWLEGHETTPAR